MSIDLIGYVRDAITPDALAYLSSTLGEPAAGIQKAFEGGVPAILAGMAGKTSTGEGIAGLLSLFRSGAAESALLMNFGPLLNSSGAASLMDFGHEVLQNVLGNKAPTVADAISSQSGVRPTSALSLLGMAGPLAMGAISKASGSQGVTVSSLLSILSSQREAIARFLPAGLGGVLGGESLSSAAAFADAGVVTPGATTNAANAAVNMDKGPIERFWPLLVLLALIVIGGLVWSINQETSPVPVNDAATSVPMTTGTSVKVVTSSAATSLGEFATRKLPNGIELNIPRLGIENKLIDFIESPHPVDKETWFDFDRLLFDTASATLQPSSLEQLDNIANILKAYPKVKARIGGYTDDVGASGANLLLSTQRARNVMAALLKGGVGKRRLSAQGYGEIHAVADNATEDGRAKNRRIAIRVTAK